MSMLYLALRLDLALEPCANLLIVAHGFLERAPLAGGEMSNWSHDAPAALTERLPVGLIHGLPPVIVPRVAFLKILARHRYRADARRTSTHTKTSTTGQ